MGAQLMHIGIPTVCEKNNQQGFIPFNLHLEIDSVSQLRMKLYDKRDDFKITIVNFPFICNNIKSTPTFGVFISQLI
jgi:hypothetical protein